MAGVFLQEKRPGFSENLGMPMIAPDLSIAQRIDTLLDAEVSEAMGRGAPVTRALALAFEQTRRRPQKVTVQFSGGMAQTCWSVSRGDGTYRVVYMPLAGYFSLTVESDFGPLDIGVHGPALGCFGSV